METSEGTQIKLVVEQNKYKVHLHEIYEIDRSHQQIQKLVEALKMKESKKHKDQLYTVCKYSFYPLFEFNLRKVQPKSEKCTICFQEYEINVSPLDELKTVSDHDIISLGRCTHTFHKGCIQRLLKFNENTWLKCPVCSVIYGQMRGDQPEGNMKIYYDKTFQCKGYTCGTIIIEYNISGGSRKGVKFHGTSRVGYLPDNQQGRKVSRLLKKAFDRKLVFTVGRSVTTGQDNVVVWNGIHHKTNLTGGSANFGYPDPTYLSRVQEELAAKGIFDD